VVHVLDIRLLKRAVIFRRLLAAFLLLDWLRQFLQLQVQLQLLVTKLTMREVLTTLALMVLRMLREVAQLRLLAL
jgi:hypothetical protein